ncbi:MAG: hypothetical protein AAF649_03310 [Verrucomicrobiota bacterium]
MDPRHYISLSILIFALHAAITLLMPQSLLEDPGIGWHLKTGELILDKGGVLDNDPFLWRPAGDQPWVQFEWLFQACAALLENAGGVPLFSAVMSFLFACIFVYLLRILLKQGCHPILAILLTVVAYLILSWHSLARPHVITYLFFLYFMDRLHDFTLKKEPVSLWPLAVAMFCWCNFHGGFVVGLILMFLTCLGLCVQAWWEKDLDALKKFLFIIPWGLGCGVVSLLNPFGITLHLHIVHAVNLECLAIWSEFAAPQLDGSNIHLLLFEVLLIGLLFLLFFKRGQVTWPQRIYLVFFLHFAFTSVRHINLFTLVCIPVVGVLLCANLEPKLGRRFVNACQFSLEHARQLRIWLITAAVVGAVWIGAALIQPGWFGSHVGSGYLSRGTVDFIRNLNPPIRRPYNTENLGGGLTYHFYPKMKIYLDDRADYYGDDLIFDEYLPIRNAESGWNQTLQQLQVDSLILQADEKLTRTAMDHPDWKMVYRDAMNAVFLNQHLLHSSQPR